MENKDLSKIKWGEIYTCGYGYDYLITKRTKRLNNGGGGLDV